MSDVRFPEMRKEVVGVLAALADRDYQQRVWIDRIYPKEGFFDDLTLNINLLYDMVLPNPETSLYTVLLNQDEVDSLSRLESFLGPLVSDLGDASDARYLSDPRWEQIVSAAKTALSSMTQRD